MNQLILTTEEGKALRMFEGKKVVPLDSASANYREWLVTIGWTQFCIVDDNDTWVLLRLDDSGSWQDTEQDVEGFLADFRLILANEHTTGGFGPLKETPMYTPDDIEFLMAQADADAEAERAYQHMMDEEASRAEQAAAEAEAEAAYARNDAAVETDLL